MIHRTIYFSAECDACKRTFPKSNQTFEGQVAALHAEKWQILAQKVFCEKCGAIGTLFFEAALPGYEQKILNAGDSCTPPTDENKDHP